MPVEIFKSVTWDYPKIELDATAAMALFTQAYQSARLDLGNPSDTRRQINYALENFERSVTTFSIGYFKLEFRGPLTPEQVRNTDWGSLSREDAQARFVLPHNSGDASSIAKARFNLAIGNIRTGLRQIGLVESINPRGWYFPVEDYAHSYKFVEGEVRNPVKAQLRLVGERE